MPSGGTEQGPHGCARPVESARRAGAGTNAVPSVSAQGKGGRQAGGCGVDGGELLGVGTDDSEDEVSFEMRSAASPGPAMRVLGRDSSGTEGPRWGRDEPL